jgi:transcription elongation factor GreB
MIENEKNYITPEGLQKLKNEYHQLFHVERPKLVETIAWAASNGDRSENADYIYGKRRLREIDARLRFLSSRMEKVEIVDPVNLKGEKVIFAATVTVEDSEGEKKVFQIVGEDEWDVKRNKISWKSPVAKALLGKKCGDEVVVRKPNGEENLTILKIEFK